MKLLDKSQELGYFFFVLLGPTRRVTLCCFSWCSAAPQSSCSGIFWMAWKRSSEIISKIAGFILCLEDSVQVITRWFWRNFAAFFLQFQYFPLCVVFFLYIYIYESGRLCIRFWFRRSMNALQNTHSHKAVSVSWYTNVTCVKGIYPVAHTTEGKYCALQEHIAFKWTLAAYQTCPKNQTNKQEKTPNNPKTCYLASGKTMWNSSWISV